MASNDRDQTADDPHNLIGGTYVVDPSRPLPGAGAGLPAFAVHERGGDGRPLMAVQVRRGAPARLGVLTALAKQPPAGILAPLAVGSATVSGPTAGRPAASGLRPEPVGAQALFVVGHAPAGASLAETLSRPWSDAELVNQLVTPAAIALEALHARRLTHRSIRPDNLFRGAPGAPVVLGSFWAAPPASLQPALYEPPYSAMCPPAGRGAGTIADDVYALGVTLLVLALGRNPLDGLDDGAIIRRKLELGSFKALVGGERLTPAIADLIRGMLAEDPEHRPRPALLLDLSAARARRVAARPPRRAQRPLELGDLMVWDARTLAHAVATNADQAVRQLRSGAAELWLRRGVGDTALANRLEEALRPQPDLPGAGARDDATRVMRAVTVLDPLAPLCWRGLSFWPDALGPLLAAAAEEGGDPRLEEVVQAEAIAAWAKHRPERCDASGLRTDGRQQRAILRMSGWSGGEPRLRYFLNPLLPCMSPLLERHVVGRIAELLPVLEARARPDIAAAPPVDREIAAFIAAHYDERIDGEISALSQVNDPGGGRHSATLSVLRLFSRFQARFSPEQKFPRLAGWIAHHAQAGVEEWRNKSRRTRMADALAAAVGAGLLADMLALLDDPAMRELDRLEAARAAEAVRVIDAELDRIVGEAPARVALARTLGGEVASTIAAMALVVAIIAAMLA